MNPSPPSCDGKQCPLCGGPNACQMCTSDVYKGSCWCRHHAFPEELLSRVPADLRNRVCVCRGCVEAAWRARPAPRPTPGEVYVDAVTGLQVFTADYLRRRGYCCGSGCRHCPWDPEIHHLPSSPPARLASAVAMGFLLAWLVLAGPGELRAGVFTEEFGSDPANAGWHGEGAPELFRWSAERKALEVTWDSSKPHGFFAHPLGVTLGRQDAFSFGFDLVLTDAIGGVHPPRTGAMQIAFGLLDLGRALREHYPRAAGRAFDLVEFNWFPQGEFPGFGVVDPTVSPAVFASSGRVAASFTFPVELAAGATHRIRCEYLPGERRLVTRLVTQGTEVEIREVILAEDFGDFSLDSFAVINWNEADGLYDSLLAHGVVDNITWEVPAPPIDRITLVGPGQVSFVSRPGWHYRLQATGDFVEWSPLTGVSGTGTEMELVDPRDAVFQTQFYRVEARPE
ncbi:MAG: cysteine-rich CWC family protein [Verrucomicrobiales bacterium]|nr:cysteine-rich CWC family protein [Verrucomicrobiales bacterium]